jgi:hypothetical protein
VTPFLMTFADGALVAVATLMVGGLIAFLKILIGMNKNVDKLVKMDVLRATDLEALSKVQRPMLVGIKASLEAQRDGECNGNVTDAHLDITTAMKEYDLYLTSLVRRGR